MISANSGWTLYNFRFELINKLIDGGFEVLIVTGEDKYSSKLEDIGCRFIPLKIDISGKNIFRDFLLLIQFLFIIKKERPSFFLAFTIKPNIYGSIAARMCSVQTINNINGLGTIFNQDNFLTKFVSTLYRVALKKSFRIFFQNNDDRLLFLNKGIVIEHKTDLLPGSGVNLERFSFTDIPQHPKNIKFRFLLVARMLWDKGVHEYVKAAESLREKYPGVEFCLLGFLDVDSPSAITKEVMENWVKKGDIRYLGNTDKVEVEMALADCIVLPSYYREGVPRALIEAAAIGRPIITTNTIGCREVVDNNVNGLLCKPRNTFDLIEKLEKMICLSKNRLIMMGKKSREKAVSQFDEKIVINKYLNLITSLV